MRACLRSWAFSLVISSTRAFLRAREVLADLRLEALLLMRLSSFFLASARRRFSDWGIGWPASERSFTWASSSSSFHFFMYGRRSGVAKAADSP